MRIWIATTLARYDVVSKVLDANDEESIGSISHTTSKSRRYRDEIRVRIGIIKSWEGRDDDDDERKEQNSVVGK